MDVVVSIENATTYTPVLRNIALNNATGVFGQELRDGQPIANTKRVVGLLDATLPFSGSITVRYTFVAPGPHGADVVFSVDGKNVSGSPLVGCGWRALPATAFTNSSALAQRQNNDQYLMLRVRG